MSARLILSRRLSLLVVLALTLALLGVGVILAAWLDVRWLLGAFGCSLALALPVYGLAMWTCDRLLPQE